MYMDKYEKSSRTILLARMTSSIIVFFISWMSVHVVEAAQNVGEREIQNDRDIMANESLVTTPVAMGALLVLLFLSIVLICLR